MTNFQVYKKTLSFSFLMFAVDVCSIAIFVGICTAGFFIADKINDMALIGLLIGFILGLIVTVAIKYLVSNRIKAAQIGMMTIGVTDNQLPEHVFKQGFAEVHGRFKKITLFFMVTNAIKNIFRRLGRAMTKFGEAVGGNVGGSIASVVDSAIQTLIGYLCDCCLGWVMYNKQKGVAKAACEGTVIFFKKGKTLLTNVGRIFLMGIGSLVLIGGAFFGILFLIFSQLPGMFNTLASEIAEAAARGETDISDALTNPTTLMLIIAGVGAFIIWNVIHSVLVRPFILTGVLRNYMEAGKSELISEADFAELDNKSPKFAKLHHMDE